MLELAFKNKFLIIVIALLIAVISIVAIQRLPVDILPNYKTSAVQVLTLYPGMPAEVMEKDITSRIERWTGQANGIARQESKSMIGVSIVKDFFYRRYRPQHGTLSGNIFSHVRFVLPASRHYSTHGNAF